MLAAQVAIGAGGTYVVDAPARRRVRQRHFDCTVGDDLWNELARELDVATR
jgi:hypothetical protein